MSLLNEGLKDLQARQGLPSQALPGLTALPAGAGGAVTPLPARGMPLPAPRVSATDGNADVVTGMRRRWGRLASLCVGVAGLATLGWWVLDPVSTGLTGLTESVPVRTVVDSVAQSSGEERSVETARVLDDPDLDARVAASPRQGGGGIEVEAEGEGSDLRLQSGSDARNPKLDQGQDRKQDRDQGVRPSLDRGSGAAPPMAVDSGPLPVRDTDKVAAEGAQREFLRRNPDSFEARVRLAEILLARLAYAEVLNVLSAPFYPQWQVRLLKARAMVGLGQVQAAEAVLAAGDPDLLEAREYHVYHAGLQHKLRRYGDAERAYLRLLETDAAVADWWIGLAIARDQANHPAAARIAYEQALRLGIGSDTLHAYALDRLRRLSPP